VESEREKRRTGCGCEGGNGTSPIRRRLVDDREESMMDERGGTLRLVPLNPLRSECIQCAPYCKLLEFERCARPIPIGLGREPHDGAEKSP
jgi:hypothetical protein